MVTVSDVITPYKPGDIVAFWGTDFLGKLIRYTTRGPSHVGIIANHPFGPTHGLVLYESTTLNHANPCLYANKPVSGVQCTSIQSRLTRFLGKRKLYRLTDGLELTDTEHGKLVGYLTKQLGNKYDYRSAVLSATGMYVTGQLLAYAYDILYETVFQEPDSPDLSTIFCSALVARSLQLTNRLNWGNPELYSPSSLLRTLKHSYTYAEVPIIE